jgi:broad specificity phosphatase PhoE
MRYLIRHAHAGSKRAWSGPDELRPLSGRGLLQAKAVVELLAGQPIRRILTSPTTRCRQTVDPLAVELRLQVDDDWALSVDAPAEQLEWLLREPATDETVLCTHGELIAALFARLDGQLDLPERPRWQKGSVWLFDGLGSPSPVARYLPPSPAGD